LPDIYVCPFCGVKKSKKDQIDFHIKYGHCEVYEYMQDNVEVQDVEEKLELLFRQKKLLEKEIDLMRQILEKKKD